MIDDPDLTVGQVATTLTIHPQTVRRYLRRGKFPTAYRLNDGEGEWRIPRADVVAFKRSRRA